MKSRSVCALSALLIFLIAVCAKATDTQMVSKSASQSEAPKVVVANSEAPTQSPTAPVVDNGHLGSDKSPMDVVKNAPKGTLKNPYKFKEVSPEVLERGRKKYLGASCNGCHGGTGGGGMCPPLSNSVWVYGSDDDTLYRLIALGSVELTAQTGLARKGRENVVGPMPAHGQIVKTDDDLWRIITFIRSNFRGEAKDIAWE